MCSHNCLELVDAGLAVELDTPVWMDESGTECNEDNAYGYMVGHVLMFPEMCFVMDEVGGGVQVKREMGT